MPQLLNTRAKKIINATAYVIAMRDDRAVDDCIAINYRDEHKRWITTARIECWFAGHSWVLDRGYKFNGADIPRVFQVLLGIDRYDPRVAMAAGFHDSVCEMVAADNVQRVIGDAIFVSLLMPIRFNGKPVKGIGPWRATLMYLGVRAYSGARFCWRYLIGRPVR